MDGLIVVVALVVIVGPVVTLIHEVGHALAALALGRRVDMLAVGHHEDVTVTIGRTVLRFGRSLDGEPAGFITLDPESSPDEVMAIALLGPVANLGTAPLFAVAAQSAATSGPFESVLWWLAVVSVLAGIGNLVPRGDYGGRMSDGRLIQVAWAVHRGRPLPELRVPEASEPGPDPRTRWPFLVILALVFVVALAAEVYGAALLMVLLFGYVALTGGHRTKAF